MKTDLTEIIHKTNLVERSHIQEMLANLGSKKKLLFELILADEKCVLSETDLMAETGTKTKSQFSTLKSQLLNDVLCNIAFANRNEAPYSDLDCNNAKIQWLIDNNLYTLAQRLCCLYKKEAFKNQLFRQALAISKNEYQTLRYIELKNRDHKLKNYNESLLEIKKFSIAYERLQHQLRKVIAIRNMQNVRSPKSDILDIQQCVEEIKDSVEDFHTQPILSIHYHLILSLTNYFSQNLEQSYTHSKSLYQLWFDHKWLIKYNMEEFLESANITFYNLFLHNRVEEVAEYLKLYKNLSQHLSSQIRKQQWFLIEFNTKLKIFHKSAKYAEVKNLLENEEQKVLGLLEYAIPLPEKMTFLTSIALSHFALKNYKQADNIMYDIKAQNKVANREDIEYFCLVFHLIIMYELMDWYRFSTNSEAVYHKLYSKKRLGEFEKDLLLFLRKQPTLLQKQKRIEVFQDFLKKLESYAKDPIKKSYFLFFDYYTWVESKIFDLNYLELKTKKILEDNQ